MVQEAQGSVIRVCTTLQQPTLAPRLPAWQRFRMSKARAGDIYPCEQHPTWLLHLEYPLAIASRFKFVHR